MTLPMLSELKRLLPHSYITVLSGRGGGDVIRGSSVCDHVVVMPRGGARWSPRWLLSLRAEGFDAAIVATGINWKAAALCRFGLGIQTVAGDGARRGLGYTQWRRVGDEHRVDANLAILSLMLPGVDRPTSRMELSSSELSMAPLLLDRMDLGAKWIAVHPGGGAEQPLKRPPFELLRETVLNVLEKKPGFRIGVIIGPEESGLGSLWSGIHPRCRVISGLSLRETAVLLKTASAIIAGDTGIGHLGAAVGTPVVTIGGPTRINCTRPSGDSVRVVISSAPPDCMPCYGKSGFQSCAHLSCLTSIGSQEVEAELESVVRK